MRYWFLFLSAIAYVAGLSSQNIIQNGGFEGLEANLHIVYGTWDFNDDRTWKSKRFEDDHISANYVDDQSHQGEQCVLLTVGAGYKKNVPWYGNVLYQKVSVDKKKKYKVSLWAKGNTSVMVHFFSLNPENGEMYSITDRVSKRVNMKWTPCEFVLSIEKNVSDEMASNYTFFCLSMTDSKVENGAVSTSFVWVDDVKVVAR